MINRKIQIISIDSGRFTEACIYHENQKAETFIAFMGKCSTTVIKCELRISTFYFRPGDFTQDKGKPIK